MKKVELLAPAGDLPKMETALRYGADAVYLGSPRFGLRAPAGSFDLQKLGRAVDLCHSLGGRLYLTLNAYLRPEEFPELESFLQELRPLDIDAYIVSDPGVVATVKRIDPDRKLHLSTQVNTTNAAAAQLWGSLGVSRVNLARELTLERIAAVRQGTSVELEVFVHGAMCVAYSGRCLLSAVLTGREANRGECAHPCRWSYALEEKTRPGEYMPVEEHQDGTFLFNSRDLCLIDHLPRLIDAGVDSLKIEGRMKSLYYVAAVTRVYRAALDLFYADPHNYVVDPLWREELDKVSHRPYGTGFLLGEGSPQVHTADSAYVRSCDFVGLVHRQDGELIVEGRNRFFPGENLELIGPGMRTESFKVDSIETLEGTVAPAGQPNMRMRIELPEGAQEGDILRRPVAD
ncbi:MAG: U32 family peptidase [Geoalkalibacter sp.]|jgi:putative protease|uniref:peptidase U32 family protein n=1 Tax=Geoalkalibacter sp. TaxID=3041440 RepID=UPI002A956672|nr:U32 family peptidase [Thermodesulfobacteriota bacterium]